MSDLEQFEYNNEEEAEMAQLHSIHIHLNAIEEVRKKLGTGPSLSHCEECGEEIPEARRIAIKGCKLCISCQEYEERNRRIYAN